MSTKLNNKSLPSEQNDKTAAYGFDRNYFKRFIHINKILFPAIKSKTLGWVLLLMVFRYVILCYVVDKFLALILCSFKIGF